MFTALLIFSFVACANGSSDAGNNNQNTTTASSTTPGAISSETVKIEKNSSNQNTAKITASADSYYLFTETNVSANILSRAATVNTAKGGTWKFYKNNVLKYSGTYKGDISTFSEIINKETAKNSEGLKLELTVTEVANDSGTLVAVSNSAAESTFAFEVKPSSSSETRTFVFEATIPAVTASETPAGNNSGTGNGNNSGSNTGNNSGTNQNNTLTGISVGNGPYILKYGNYLLFSGITLTTDVQNALNQIDHTLSDNVITITATGLADVFDMGQIRCVVIHNGEMKAALSSADYNTLINGLTENTHYTMDNNSFVVLTDSGYQQAQTAGLLRNMWNSSGSGSSTTTTDSFRGHTYESSNKKYEFGNDGTMTEYSRIYSTSTYQYENEYERTAIYSYELNSSGNEKFIVLTPTKKQVTNNDGTKALKSCQELIDEQMSLMGEFANTEPTRSIIRYRVIPQFLPTTYRITEYVENETTYYRFRYYTSEDTSASSLLRVGPNFSTQNARLSGSIFDRELFQTYGTSLVSLAISSTQMSGMMAAIDTNTVSFQYTITTGETSETATANFTCTKTWDDGVATITLSPSNDAARTFLGTGTDSLQFVTQSSYFNIRLLTE